MPLSGLLATAMRNEYRSRADELAGRPRLAGRVEESPDFTEQGDC
jgi:hypothetical protein